MVAKRHYPLPGTRRRRRSSTALRYITSLLAMSVFGFLYWDTVSLLSHQAVSLASKAKVALVAQSLETAKRANHHIEYSRIGAARNDQEDPLKVPDMTGRPTAAQSELDGSQKTFAKQQEKLHQQKKLVNKVTFTICKNTIHNLCRIMYPCLAAGLNF